MSFARWTASVFACLLVLPLGGCSSDDGIEGTGKSEGSSSGFGSVFVNGVEFDTDAAEVIVDGEQATEDALEVGMVLRVGGSFDGLRGNASRVEFDRRIAGPVDAVAPDEKRITALGQTVRVDENTVFVGTSIDALGSQDLVAVSGFLTASGDTLATRIERRPEPYEPGSTVDVEGIVRDVTVTTCRIGGLTVDYTTAVFEIEGGPLEVGAFVEAVGSQPVRGGILYASRMAIEDPTVAAPGERVELSGLIAGFSGLGRFSVSGQAVDASRAARTDNAAVAPADDVHIEVEGTIDETGLLVADAFSVRPSSDVDLVGPIESVDRSKDRFVISGTVVQAEPTTQYEDQSAARLRTFRVEDLEPGDAADVRGFRDADGDVVATRVIRLDTSAP